MGITVESRRYEMNLTAVAGGSVGAFVAGRVGKKLTEGTMFAAASDSVAAGVFGKMKTIPQILGGTLAAGAARNAGASDSVSALSAHVGRRTAKAMPEAEAALGKLAQTAENAGVRGAARAGEFALHEAPGAVGAVTGAKLVSPMARGAVKLGFLAVGALAGGLLLQSVAPAVTWTTDSPGKDARGGNG